MNSKIYVGEVTHARLAPVRHAFRYPVYFYSFDLDELPALPGQIPFFGYNRRRPAALHDKDYLAAGDAPIREKLKQLLARVDGALEVARVDLVTSARYFNYVFNPVSFFLCRRADGALNCAVAEVCNTFGEKHIYVLDSPIHDGAGTTRFRHAKEFHVSPFHDMAGEYRFEFSRKDDTIDIRVNMSKNGEDVFLSRLRGHALPLTGGNLWKTLGRFPLTALLTVPRILGQAARLRWQKKLPVFSKPPPRSPLTTRSTPPSLLDRLCMRVVLDRFRKMGVAGLTIRLPDGRTVSPGDASAEPDRVIRVLDYRFFRRLVFDDDVGFGDSFMRGEWTCEDLPGLLTRLARHLPATDQAFSSLAWGGRLLNRLAHGSRRNTRRGSRRNIQVHYDLSNDFYRLFLDETLTYSCGIYRDGSESLEQAQLNKIHRIIEKAQIRQGDHVLEIGSGWGGLAIEAARATGCRVTTITLSDAQKHLAEERIRKAGLNDRVGVLLKDYRDVDGKFDAIVSVEMLEAVGHEHLRGFFACCDRVLKPGGRMVAQVITIPDSRYERYLRGCDWIQKRIFPGGHLPSLGALRQALNKSSRLRMAHVENIGPHYAQTLREWRERFLKRLPEVRALGFDEDFIRMWIYYLSYCQAGFATRQLDNLQLVLTRADAMARQASGVPGLEVTAATKHGKRVYGNLTPVR